jgi:hypothetical protein
VLSALRSMFQTRSLVYDRELQVISNDQPSTYQSIK